MTVTLPSGLAGIIKTMSAKADQDESKVITELLIDALIYCRGNKDLAAMQLNTPLIRLANSVMCLTIDSGADTVCIVPTEERLKFRYYRRGEPVKPLRTTDNPFPFEAPGHFRFPLFARFEHMAGILYGKRVHHPEAAEQGRIPLSHLKKNYDIGVRFILGQPEAIGEALELTVVGPLEER